MSWTCRGVLSSVFGRGPCCVVIWVPYPLGSRGATAFATASATWQAWSADSAPVTDTSTRDESPTGRASVQAATDAPPGASFTFRPLTSLSTTPPPVSLTCATDAVSRTLTAITLAFSLAEAIFCWYLQV